MNEGLLPGLRSIMLKIVEPYAGVVYEGTVDRVKVEKQRPDQIMGARNDYVQTPFSAFPMDRYEVHGALALDSSKSELTLRLWVIEKPPTPGPPTLMD